MPSESESQQFSRWAEYGPLLGAVACATVEAALGSPLALYTDERLGMFYAPFDHVETGARVAIVGVTPGPTQAFAAIRSAQAALADGLAAEEILAGVKQDASFRGMRQDLIAWFDDVGLADIVGLASCSTLFDTPAGLLHTTSAVRDPTFRRTPAGWQNWNGYGIGPVDHRVLRAMVVRALGPRTCERPRTPSSCPLARPTRRLSTSAASADSTGHAACSASRTRPQPAHGDTRSSPQDATTYETRSRRFPVLPGGLRAPRDHATASNRPRYRTSPRSRAARSTKPLGQTAKTCSSS